MKQRITTILLVLLTATIAFSAIDISGHARVRPRFDTLDWGTIGNDGLQSKTDIYYWYRVRLDFKATIGFSKPVSDITDPIILSASFHPRLMELVERLTRVIL